MPVVLRHTTFQDCMLMASKRAWQLLRAHNALVDMGLNCKVLNFFFKSVHCLGRFETNSFQLLLAKVLLDQFGNCWGWVKYVYMRPKKWKHQHVVPGIELS